MAINHVMLAKVGSVASKIVRIATAPFSGLRNTEFVGKLMVGLYGLVTGTAPTINKSSDPIQRVRTV